MVATRQTLTAVVRIQRASSAPRNLTASPALAGEVLLVWVLPDDTGALESDGTLVLSWVLEWTPEKGFAPDLLERCSLVGETREYSVGRLTVGKLFYFRLAAITASGRGVFAATEETPVIPTVTSADLRLSSNLTGAFPVTAILSILTRGPLPPSASIILDLPGFGLASAALGSVAGFDGSVELHPTPRPEALHVQRVGDGSEEGVTSVISIEIIGSCPALPTRWEQAFAALPCCPRLIVLRSTGLENPGWEGAWTPRAQIRDGNHTIERAEDLAGVQEPQPLACNLVGFRRFF